MHASNGQDITTEGGDLKEREQMDQNIDNVQLNLEATMISYDENIPEEDLVNISTNYCLYNVEGFMPNHLSPHFFCSSNKVLPHCVSLRRHLLQMPQELKLPAASRPLAILLSGVLCPSRH